METNALIDRIVDTWPGEGVASWALLTVAALATVASLLVGTSTYAVLGAGAAGVGLGTLAALGLFAGTIAVFEAGRTLGAAQ